jgi:aerobic-type carbon monoxide dehydrogenase small subunit (CoxS/CutS family)
MKSRVAITVNHELREIEVDHGLTLLELLRDVLKIKSVHRSCGEGECGACTVLLDGRAVCSCLTLAGPTPRRMAEIEQFLQGKKATADVILEAAGIAAQTVQPRSSFRADAEYRRDMARVLTQRALTAGLEI